jgi:hypothetical protein
MKRRKFFGTLTLGTAIAALAPESLAQPTTLLRKIAIYRDGLIYEDKTFADILRGDLITITNEGPKGIWYLCVSDAFIYELEGIPDNTYSTIVDKPTAEQTALAQEQYDCKQRLKEFLS